MFVATREIRSAKGRFGLMVAVVALVALLLVVLSALTAGLGRRSTSAVEALPAQRVVLAPATSAQPSFTDSLISPAQQRAWVGAQPLGIGHARLEHDGAAATVAVFGAEPGSAVARAAGVGDGIVLPRSAADALGVGAGSRVTAGATALVVTGVVDDEWYSHSAVAYLPMTTFAQVTHQDRPTALLVDDTDDARLAALDARVGTRTLTRADALKALPGYTSERSSLLLVQGFLYGISALVVVAFVSVWTVQRTRDLAVLRALGASRGYVLRDALGQAAVLLLVATALGLAVGAAAVLGIGSAAPVLAAPATFAVPAAGILTLGLAGSFLATRRVSRVDPLLALGGN